MQVLLCCSIALPGRRLLKLCRASVASAATATVIWSQILAVAPQFSGWVYLRPWEPFNLQSTLFPCFPPVDASFPAVLLRALCALMPRVVLSVLLPTGEWGGFGFPLGHC